MTVDLITRAESITAETTFDDWIAGFTVSRADGEEFYALSLSSMRELFNGVRESKLKRPIGFR